MQILITGARGFVGKNLIEALKAVRDGKDNSRQLPRELTLLEATRETSAEELGAYCARADFVFHLAGVNRPEREEEFFTGNRDFTSNLLGALEAAGNTCPVLLTSSTQAERENSYGLSKCAGEALVRAHEAKTGAKTLIYRLPNLFGKWCRPHYNSVVATFCHQIARDLPIAVSDPAAGLTLCYIDDVVDELLRALAGKETREGDFCVVAQLHGATLGEIAALLHRFRAQSTTLCLPEIPPNSFAKKLYSTYLSCLPAERVRIPLTMHSDQRGSFTELLKTENSGQFSVNVSLPAITKGQHWHNSKWEFFIVVSGEGLIQQRKIGTDELLEFVVSGARPEAVHMLPGYTHNIINRSQTDKLITLMWANEAFDSNKPDTFFEEV